MTTTLIDDYEAEADYDREAEDYETEDYDSESEDFEDARSNAARRQRTARARRIRAAQMRAAQARTRRPSRPTMPPAPTTPRQTVAAIRHLDLEHKVGEDSLRSAIERANRRAARATYATVASVAIDQAFDTFEADLKGHDIVRAGLRAAPLLLLSPQRQRPGIEGVLLDPRYMGAAIVAGLVTVGHFRDRGDDVERIDVAQEDLDSGTTNGQLFAVAVNKKGADTGQDVTWAAAPGQSVLQLLDRDGHFTIPKPVTQDTIVPVTATAGGTSRTVFLRLRPAAPKPGTNGPTTAAATSAKP